MKNIDYSDLQALCNHLEDCLEQGRQGNVNRGQALETLEVMFPQEIREKHPDVILEWLEGYNFRDSETAFWCTWFLELAIEECPSDPVKKVIEMITE